MARDIKLISSVNDSPGHNVGFQELLDRATLAEMLNDASIDQVLAFDMNLHIISWNKTCELISGIPTTEAVGKHLHDVFPAIPSFEEVAQAIAMSVKGFKTFVPADKGSYKGGYYENHFIPLKDENGNQFGVMNIMHDVTHRIKYEDELKRLNKALVRKNLELKRKNDDLLSFTHVTSHDLKEPLRKIYTFVELIMTQEGKQLSEKSRHYFRRVQASVQRLGLLTDDILAYAQINSVTFGLSDVDLNASLRRAVSNLSHIIQSKQASVEIGELPVIKGCDKMIVQLFQNLLSNAIKFQEPGAIPRITISASIVKGRDIKNSELAPDTAYCCISVADNGIGFEKKYEQRIFQMFQRLHGSGNYSGTGIGLTLCRKIMDMHNGIIAADSVLGDGSTFYCYFPLNA